ncbi:MAG: diguanylate cyclase, partial [Verrucomicrobia bacterium]|nr:diguanylate cyclase [Verrucomicrobiota bacterium]
MERSWFHAPTGQEASRILQEHAVVCLLLNIVLPDMDGRLFMSHLRENAATAGIPVLLLGDHIDDSAKEHSLLQAADGFLESTRDIDAMLEWVSKRIRRGPETTKPARRDTLTGLMNRAAFRESFARTQKECANSGEPLAVAALSLDASRGTLDSLDESTREELLQSFGLQLSHSLRNTDLVARWGV